MAEDDATVCPQCGGTRKKYYACPQCGWLPASMHERGTVEITVTRSAGDDRGVVVFIDTDFEPNASDGGPGLRVLINDDEAYVGKAYDLGAHHEARDKKLEVTLDEIAYTGRETFS